MKIALALMSYAIMIRAIHAHDLLLSLYWLLVMMYWEMNYMEGKK